MSEKITGFDLVTTPSANDSFAGVQDGDNYEFLTSQILRSPVDVHNVKHYGAIGDAGNDDTAAIQSALDETGTIYFPPGTYKVTGTLTISSSSVLLGYGAAIKHDVATEEDVLHGADLENITILGLEIDGQEAQKAGVGTSTGRGIHLEAVTNAIVADCYVHDCYEHGIRIGDTPAADSASSQYIFVRGNRCEDNGNTSNDRGYGIFIMFDADDVIVSSNMVINCVGGGISLDDVSDDATANKEIRRLVVANNVVDSDPAVIAIHNLLRGISIEGCYNVSVTGNTVVGELLTGILLNDGQSESFARRCVVSGNNVDVSSPDDTVTHGIRVVDSIGALVQGNYVRVMGANEFVNGISCHAGNTASSVDNVAIIGNLVLCNKRGISTEISGDAGEDRLNVSIIGNDIRPIGDITADNEAIGIALYKVDGGIVKGNIVREYYIGIDVDTTCTRSKIMDNESIDNGSRGIKIDDPCIVIRNYTEGNADSGLRIEANGDNAATVVAFNYANDATPFSGTSNNLESFGNNFLPAIPDYTINNVTPDRAYDADATSDDEIADVLGTLIADLIARGVLQ